MNEMDVTLSDRDVFGDDVTQAIDKYHEERTERRRTYLGASQIGREDATALWLEFRWAFEVVIDGRIKRLFRRGHNEEQSVVDDLTAIGCDIIETVDNQRSIDFGCHVRGHSDGIIQSGLINDERTPHLLEIKTISRKRFNQLEKHGLELSNPVYWVQCHTYMHGIGLEHCLFYAVCKDDDRVYTERITLDSNTAKKYIKRAHEITMSDSIPPLFSENPTDWRFNFSDYYAIYFPDYAEMEHWKRLKVQRETDSDNPIFERMCLNWRNDAQTTVRENDWYSERYQSVIPDDYMGQYDDSHVLHPDLMKFAGWRHVGALDDNTAIYQAPDGRKVANGKPRKNVFSSEAILRDTEKVLELSRL